MRERMDPGAPWLTEDDGISFVLLLPNAEPLFHLRKPWRNMLHANFFYLYVFTCSSLHLLPPPKSGTLFLTTFPPNARTVFMPREIRRDQMCTDRTEGDCVTGGLSKNTATAWMWELIRPMQVPLITPSLLWLLLTLSLTDKTLLAA